MAKSSLPNIATLYKKPGMRSFPVEEAIKGTLMHGALRCQLAGALNIFPHINQVSHPVRRSPLFNGSPDDFISRSDLSSPSSLSPLKAQMKNKVRVCGNAQCGKPVAFTLPKCNACGFDLSSSPISYTDNVFTSFIYGIGKSSSAKPFPFQISIRAQTEHFLCFDDPLSLTPAHFNCIPTTHYLPDWRSLLLNPKQGLALVDSMFDMCFQVAKEQFLNDHNYRNIILRSHNNDSKYHDDHFLKTHAVVAGFNNPPSQYQLHLQFMLLPMVPFHYSLFLKGVHYTPNRFVPWSYVRAVLALNQPFPNLQDNTPQSDIFTFYRDQFGVDYDEHLRRCSDNAEIGHGYMANWHPILFRGVVWSTSSGHDEHFEEFQASECNSCLQDTSLPELIKLYSLLSSATTATTATATTPSSSLEKEILIENILKARREIIEREDAALREHYRTLKLRENEPDPFSPFGLIQVYSAKDKEVLQNYGRPYNASGGGPGKPTGSYYLHPKAPLLPARL